VKRRSPLQHLGVLLGQFVFLLCLLGSILVSIH
jgi:hypothetical protein